MRQLHKECLDRWKLLFQFCLNIVFPTFTHILQPPCLNCKLQRYDCFIENVWVAGDVISSPTIQESRQGWLGSWKLALKTHWNFYSIAFKNWSGIPVVKNVQDRNIDDDQCISTDSILGRIVWSTVWQYQRRRACPGKSQLATPRTF